MLFLPVLFLLLALFLIGFLLVRLRHSQAQLRHHRGEIATLEKDKKNLETVLSIEEARRLELERDQTEHEKKLSEQLHLMERFRHLVEDTEEFLFECDYKGNFIYANPVMLRRLGYATEELSALSYSELVDPERKREIFQFYQDQYYNKQADSYAEWQIINRFGESLWVGLRVRMTFNHRGLIASVKGIARDLSIQRNRERQSEEQRKRYDDMFSLFPYPVLVFQKAGKELDNSFMVLANKATLQLLNLDWFEVAGIRLDDVSSSLAETVASQLRGENDHPDQASWSPKNQPDTMFEVVSVENQQHILVLLLRRSIGDARLAHLENERDFYRMILEEMPFELAVFSADERFVYINPSAVKKQEVRQWMLGKTDGDYMKFRHKSLFNAIIRRQRFLEAREAGETICFEELFLTAEKKILHYNRHLKPVFGSNQQIEYFIAGGYNYTDIYQENEPSHFLQDRWLLRSSVWKALIEQNGHELGSWPGIFDFQGFENEGFQNFYRTVPAFAFQLQRDFPAIRFQNNDVLRNHSTMIYSFPALLVEESIRLLLQLSSEKPDCEFILHQEKGSSLPVLVGKLQYTPAAFQSINSIAGALTTVWDDAGFTCKVSEFGIQLEVPMIDQRSAIPKNHFKNYRPLEHISMLAGPPQHFRHKEYCDLLKGAGCILTEAGSINELASFLSSKPFQLLLWWDNIEDEVPEIVPEILERRTLKLLMMDGSYHAQIRSKWILALEMPDNEDDFLELVWVHARPSDGKNHQNQYYEEDVKLSFEKLIEITDGDQSFMQSLLQSYRSSLLECQEVFLARLEAVDAEGLRFLLHKARATIKTFEIRPLENVIREAIEVAESPRGVTNRQKKELIFRLKQICTETLRQITDYARDNHIAS